ncbi:hypothetical protein KCG51_00370 [Neisseria subflava]|uniref:hypothetical protein n=1 Tax=Neisseria subflava TaxID=28449 RepID=UPI0020B676AC|nr:hypothetical protein [Neisseria subflava]UTG77311.1 hypothetical protein KCG51_00370 [Neisseria subflava]
MRDNFNQTIKDKLCFSVGGYCSNPDCGISTRAKDINIGIAAHICAASQQGPRFDPKMSSRERSSYENGIWLCSNCASLIDRDTSYYTKDLLESWKEQAEALWKERLGTSIHGKIKVNKSRDKDIEFLNIYMEFAPFTQIPIFFSYAPNSINIHFLDITYFWELACEAMPHLCQLQDIKLRDLFRKFISYSHELTDIINGHLVDAHGYWIHHYLHNYGDILHLNEELPIEHSEYIKRVVLTHIENIYATYQEIISYINSFYSEIRM